MDFPGGESDERAPARISAHVARNIDRVLGAIRTHLGMDVAFVSEFLGENRIFRHVDHAVGTDALLPGTVLPMSVGYCAHVVAGRLPELIPDTSRNQLARSLPETADIPIGAHLSVPIRIDRGRVFGTFCCFSYERRPELGERDLDLMHTFGALIATEIAADLREDEQRREKEDRLKKAVGNGDPNIVFQPIVDLADLTVVGVEALSRFRTMPLRGPDLWFADAQELGMAASLELLAARKALAAAAALPEHLSVNVNLSPATVAQGGVGSLADAFDPKRLVIELTELIPIDDYDPIVDAIVPLRDRGIRIAIDDAGAGYSSLRRVLMLRPDIIKFDLSLTAGINTDPVRRAMVAALSEFASHTGVSVVAEGVETEEELATLRELKIARGQGFLFGRPQPASEIVTLAAAPQR